ncbi:hypothetical protein [Leptolyngbya ohadii]|uniref:hypothetical protein n=1 Tax=Leptolyngbya ohadii TaxID=1962290 RepID=UPI0015C5B845|nr:hypothetical protein [Leptolyngbya ohadii]
MTYRSRDGLLWEAEQLLGVKLEKVDDLRPHLPGELRDNLGTNKRLQEAVEWLKSQKLQ